MTDYEFEEWCLTNHIPENGKAYLSRVRKSAPARLVLGKRRNVVGVYPSGKMHFTVQFESHTCELCGIYICEYSDDVIEYYDQPETGQVQYIMDNGRSRYYPHTADILVITKDGAFLDQWKTEEELVMLQGEYPDRYGRDDQSTWHYYPGEAWATGLGLVYRVRSSAEIDVKLFRNLQFLEDYLREHNLKTPESSINHIMPIVEATPGVSVLELLSTLTREVTNDHLFFMIATRQIFVDLTRCLLVEPDKAYAYPDETSASAMQIIDRSRPPVWATDVKPVTVDCGEAFTWSGVMWVIVHVGINDIVISRKHDDQHMTILRNHFEDYVRKGFITGLTSREPDTKQAAMDILKKASKSDLAEAVRRYKIIEARILNRKPIESDCPDRTERRYWKSFKHAELEFGYGFVGLLPQNCLKGNSRTDPPEKIQLIDEAINEYNRPKAQTLKSVLQQLNLELTRRGLPTISRKTFSNKIRDAITKVESTYSREGKRAGIAVEDIDWSQNEIPPHGDWPFHIVHIDHTELDLELVTFEDDKNLGKVWLTLMIDARTRRVLALSVCFDPPSYRSIMCVLQECVRRYSRLPHTIVVDNGSEFESVYFSALAALHTFTIKRRPKTEPRFGCVIERLFGTLNKTFLYNLWGNTQATKKVRTMTKAVNPKLLAIWPPDRFHARLEEWAYETYDSMEHPALGMSPALAFESGMALTGYRKHKLIPYDLIFIMTTLPSTRKGKAKVQNTGVKINNIYYSCEEFRKPGVRGTSVDVRYHPFDASVAYAYVNGEWRHCTSKYRRAFAGKSERDIQLFTTELIKRNRNNSSFTVSDKILAEFIERCEEEEKELFELRRLRAIENHKLLKLSNLEQMLPSKHNVKLPRTDLSCRPEDIPSNSEESALEIYEEVRI